MNDLLLFFGGIVGIFCIGTVIYSIEKMQGCWHKWGKWIVWQTEDAYCQGRRCDKCGCQELIQTRKIKEKKDGHTDC